MRLILGIGKRAAGDNRITLLRFESRRWAYREGWKISLSLHRRLFMCRRQHRELRATLLGLNIHWRGA